MLEGMTMKNVLTFAAVTFGTLMMTAPAFAGLSDAIHVPEPMSMSLLVGGIAAIAVVKRMRRK